MRLYIPLCNGGCRREEKNCKHWSLFTMLLSSVTDFFFFLWHQIKSNCMYWLHWKSEKNRTEPNELDELKYSRLFNQTTSFAHFNAFLYLHALVKTLIYLFYLKSEKKSKLNKLNELEYLKTPSQMSSSAHWHVFLICLLKQVWKYLFIYRIWNQKE